MSVEFKPFHYQPRMIQWLLDHPCAGLFCSPSMGKCATTLMAISERILSGESKGACIISPKRVSALTWPQQIKTWNHSAWMKVADMRSAEGQKAWEDGSADIYLINYEMLSSRDINRKCRFCKNEEPKVRKCLECRGTGIKTTHVAGFAEKFLKKRKTIPVDTLVWDEISLAANPSSKRVQSVRPFRDLFKYHIGLTGSPCQTYLDLFAQIRLLDGGKRLGNGFTAFRDTYFESDYMGYKFTIRPGAKEKIDAKIADLCLVMLSDDYLDVPTCTSTDIEVTLPPAAEKAYKTMEKELLIELEKSDIVALNAATLSGKLLQITGGAVYDEHRNVEVIHDAKIKALLALRKKHGSEPMLVLTQFKHEMARVLEAVPGSRRFDEKDMEEWQAGKIHTWVAQPQSMSHGIDGLQKSSRIAVWMTPPWSNEVFIQTNARIVRTGQSHETLIYRIIAANTIDLAVVEALRFKGDTQSGLMQALKNLQQLRTPTK